MPSIFSRARTTSTPQKNANHQQAYTASPIDEFGRVPSRGAVSPLPFTLPAGGLRAEGGSPLPPPTPPKKPQSKRDRAAFDTARQRTLSAAQTGENDEGNGLSGLPDGTFLPLNLDPPPPPTATIPGSATDDPNGQNRVPAAPQADYGYLSYQRHVVLGLEQARRLIDVLCDELCARALTTPFIFSSLALDVNASAIRRLLAAFLRTCAQPSSREADHAWREEAKFAGPHELAMALRWGLARLVRLAGGQEVRGLLDYTFYLEWREAEAATNYPPAHFATFLLPLQPLVRSILITTFTLLARLTAHSSSSGHTPPSLSPLFGPLLFGLGPATLLFHHTYVHYLRAVYATEHLLLAFVRWQDIPPSDPSSAARTSTVEGGTTFALGVPKRLKDWIRGYPSMLPAPEQHAPNSRPQPRRGARTVRVVSVRRNVRMYSPDLVRTAASWARQPRPGQPLTQPAAPGAKVLVGSKEWDRIAPPTLKLPPRYSDNYKKRMDLASGFHPDTGAGSTASLMSTAPSASSSLSSSTTSTLADDKDYFGFGSKSPLGGKEGEFKSLTDFKWGEFESIGFGGLSNEKKLQFDLTEGARAARSAKRATMSWDDFSNAGFTRTDAPLSDTLQFSTPVAHTISAWPTHSAEIHRKLKKTQKALPSFGWDTEPVMGSEEWIEEAFVDVFCDLVYGSGWMDLERSEEVDRECNWALVEFKSMPVSRSTTSGSGDPRTASTILLFEEFVPAEYRQQLIATGQRRRRLPAFFSPSKNKTWKQAPTLNGRPYVVGHFPPTPTNREADFEMFLRSNTSVTKVMTLDGKGGLKNVLPNTPQAQAQPASGRTTPRPAPIQPRLPSPPPAPVEQPDSPLTPGKAAPTAAERRQSRFRMPHVPSHNRNTRLTPADSQSVDFETRLASYSDEELNGNGDTPGGKRGKSARDEAWVDILVAKQSRRMPGQDADPRLLRRGLGGGRSDPELASQEVAAALSGLPAYPLSDDEGDMEPVAGAPRESYPGYPGQEQLEPSFVESATPAASERQFPRDERDSQYSFADDVSATTGDGGGEEEEVDGDEASSRSALDALRARAAQGYFSRHPERKQATSVAEDPRDKLARDEDDEDEANPTSPYGDLEDHPNAPSSQAQQPLPATPVRPLPVPQDHPPLQTPPKGAMPPAVPGKTPPEGMGMGNAGGQASAKAIGGKTSALIEMYRQKEKEREKGGSASPEPSRLPVRTGSQGPRPVESPQPQAQAKPAGVRPLPSPTASPSPPAPAPAPAPATAPAPAAAPAAAAPTQSPAAAALSASEQLQRYVHGAPLHNVTEEEEEEE